MKKVRSRDGTEIAYESTGQGPTLILVAGAFSDRTARTAGTPLAALLASRFTAISYDRRGRGDSTDTAPYAVAREVEDLEAVISDTGGSAFVYGISSGAVLAIEATIAKLPIKRLALYEPPLLIDDSRSRPPADFADQLAALAASGRRGDAAAKFLTEGVNVPPAQVAQMRAAPFWSGLEKLAHTLAYDATLTADGASLIARAKAIAIGALVLDGGNSPPWMRQGVKALAEALPKGQYRTLAGQTHDIAPDVLRPELEAFFVA